MPAPGEPINDLLPVVLGRELAVDEHLPRRARIDSVKGSVEWKALEDRMDLRVAVVVQAPDLVGETHIDRSNGHLDSLLRSSNLFKRASKRQYSDNKCRECHYAEAYPNPVACRDSG